MSEAKFVTSSITEDYQFEPFTDNKAKWREARLTALRKLEALVAAAHGRMDDDDSSFDPEEDQELREPRQSSLRDCLIELSALCNKS